MSLEITITISTDRLSKSDRLYLGPHKRQWHLRSSHEALEAVLQLLVLSDRSNITNEGHSYCHSRHGWSEVTHGTSSGVTDAETALNPFEEASTMGISKTHTIGISSSKTSGFSESRSVSRSSDVSGSSGRDEQRGQHPGCDEPADTFPTGTTKR